jgi:hypothetical protein
MLQDLLNILMDLLAIQLGFIFTMLEKVKRKDDKKENMSGESQIVFDPMEL